MFTHILISTDGSPVSNKAAKAGIALASALGAKVTAYCAVEPMQILYAEDYAFDQEFMEGIEARAGASAEACRRDRQVGQSGWRPLRDGGYEGLHALRGNHCRCEKTEV